MFISRGLLVLGMVFGMAAGGVVDRVVDVCKTCRKEADLVGSYRCALGAQRVLLDVRECPGVSVYVGPETLVTGFQGTAEAVNLARTTLGCGGVDAPTVILNTVECESRRPAKVNGNGDDNDINTKTTTTTTTTMKYPVPVPFPVPVGNFEGNSSSTTTSTTTFTASTTTTVRRPTTTMIIAITAGMNVNGTLVIVTLAVCITAVGVICTVRIVKRRLGRRQTIPRPIQVPVVSSTSPSPSLDQTVRKRSRSRDSFESVELFTMKRD